MDAREMYPLVIGTVEAAVVEDNDRVADNLAMLSEPGDPIILFVACRGFAEVGKRAMLLMGEAQAFDPARGDMVILEELEPGAFGEDPPSAFALRFLAAHTNDDNDTAFALFKAALDAGPEAFVPSVCALINTIAGIVRAAGINCTCTDH